MIKSEFSSNRLKESGSLPGLNHASLFLFCFVLFLRFLTSYVVTAQDYSDWFYNPFNKNSAIHRPIGTGAIYAGDDDSATITWLQHFGLKFNYEHPYGGPFVAVDETDSIVTVNFSPSQVTNNNGSLPVDLRIPKYKWPVNNVAAGSNPDAAVAIYDRTTGKIHDLYNYRYNNGAPLATIHRAHDITGLGHGTTIGQRVGVSASGVSIMFGTLQPWELEKPDHTIGHAFQLVLPRKPQHYQPQLISKNIQWPATTGDGTAVNPNENLGYIPYGGLMAIPPVDKGGPDLDTMGLSPPGLRLAKALRDYGAYVVDGGQTPIIRTTANFSTSLYNQLHFKITDDLKKIYREMRLVKNSVIGATARMRTTWGQEGFIGTPTWPAGGGEPLAPNMAIDAATSIDHVMYGSGGVHNIVIFPNPAKDRIYIYFKDSIGNESVELINLMGQRIMAEPFSGSPMEIYLPPGQNMYFVRVTNSNESKTFKVLAQCNFSGI